MTNVIYPDGYSITNNFNLIGQLTNTVDSGGMSVTNWFNIQGLLAASDAAFGQLSSKSYDILDRITTNVDNDGLAIAETYDNLNRPLTVSYPDGESERWLYQMNVLGPSRFTKVTSERVYYGYDQDNRKVFETNGLGYVTQYGYDGASDLIQLTDQNSNVTQWGYDLYGRVTSKVAAGTTILTYGYDPDDRLASRLSPAKGTTTYGYDQVGNLTSVTNPVSPSLFFGYNALRWMTDMTDGTETTTFTYTPAGQVASETGPWASDGVSYTYTNRLRTGLSLQQPNGAAWAQSYSYDGVERLKGITSPAGTFGYTYNTGLGGVASASSLVGGLSLPNGASISNTFDVNGKVITNCLYKSGGAALDCDGYIYDNQSEVYAVTRFAQNYSNYSIYAYDLTGEVVSDQAYEWDETPRLNEQLGYAFDPAGNLTNRINNALLQNFKVNNLNELTTNTNGGTLTVVGTATSQNSDIVTVNGTNAAVYGDATFVATNMPLTTSYTAIASDSYGRHSTNTVTVSLSTNVGFQYDGNGNLTSDGLRNFVYDDENELIQVSVSYQWMSEFSYDGKMRRRIRKEYSWQSGTWVQTNEVHYVYDGNLVIQERDVNNLPTVTYTRGKDLSGSLQGAGGIGGLLARTSQVYSGGPLSGQSFYHSDANGNVTMLIDSNQGIVAKYLYDAFGNTISKSGQLSEANVYRFSSKEWHANSGLAYYLYRYYDPNSQRWLNRDPLGEMGGVNLYGYAVNNPLSIIDLWGLMSKCDCDKLRGQIFRKAKDLLDDLQRYDPVQDGLGGHPMDGGRFTKPGGHFQEILERQGGLKDDLTRYFKECVSNDDDPSAPIPRRVDDMANRRVPLPVFPSPNPIIHVPGSASFWNDVAMGATYTGVGAGIIATGGILGGLVGGGATFATAGAAF
jgi:RHS repeat-associated protein